MMVKKIHTHTHIVNHIIILYTVPLAFKFLVLVFAIQWIYLIISALTGEFLFLSSVAYCVFWGFCFWIFRLNDYCFMLNRGAEEAPLVFVIKGRNRWIPVHQSKKSANKKHIIQYFFYIEQFFFIFVFFPLSKIK